MTGPRVVCPAPGVRHAGVRHPTVRVETPGQVRADQERGQGGPALLYHLYFESYSFSLLLHLIYESLTNILIIREYLNKEGANSVKS